MTFEQVYVSLKELFPQIDARALRAVAIEHSKDVDAAVVAVLEEIIPFFTGRSTPSSPLSQSVGTESSVGVLSVRTDALAQSQNDSGLVSGNRQPSSCDNDGPSEPFYDPYVGQHEVEDKAAGMTIQMNANVHSLGESVVIIGENRVETSQVEVSGDPQMEKAAPADVSGDPQMEEAAPADVSGDPQMEEAAPADVSGDPQMEEAAPADIKTSSDIIPPTAVGVLQDEMVADVTAHNISVSTSSVQLVEVPDMHGSNLDKSNLFLSTDTDEKNMNSILSIEDESTSNSAMSSQIHVIDAMEEIIADARNNKRTLFLEMESVVKLMKQVEVKEQAAEQAKNEAANGGMDLLNQAEELKTMLQRAKEANDMHAGEVYGEKAILATELRELQSRVRSLSDERDKSLADLDEMHQILEVRLAAAVNEIESAELKKLEKEKVARKFLGEQKLIMEVVVQESKILKQQAEDNAKLQEFLVDRGRVVDTLQGEIAVICQDVKLLKEKFDQHVPLDKSLFSGHTSFILASSSSSLKSLVPDQVETLNIGVEPLETENNTDHEKVREDEAAAREDCKVHVEDDDGWEFFDSSEANA